MSRRKVEINRKHASLDEIKKLYRETNDAKLKVRYLAIMLFMEEKTSLAVAETLRISDFAVREWLKKYNILGLEGLIPQKHLGAECKLSEEQLQEVYLILQNSPRDWGFNNSNWSMRLLKLWIEKQYRVSYAVSSLYDLVHRLGLTIQRPRKKSKNGDPAKQEQFMEELKEIVENTDNDTVILYEDEAIITDEPTTIGKWAPIGEQPIVATDSKGKRERRVIFGAVNPATGDVLYSAEEAGNSEKFESFLK